jgi:peroxiredoxin
MTPRRTTVASLETPVCDFGAPAPDFALPGVDGRIWTPDDCRGEKGLVVTFICTHCPYVKAVRERIVRDARGLQALGIGCVGIMSNDPSDYPEDSFGNMQRVADEYGFSFPYLVDETQAVAQAYGAVCTPDFFGYNAGLALQYRGRLDASRKETAAVGVRRDLYEAMRQVAETGRGPQDQIPSMGCSIKWKAA